MNLNDELDNLSPWLRDMRQRDDGFRTPDGYFDRLEDDVFRSIDAIGARRRPTALAEAPRPWWQRLRWPTLALALGSGLLLTVAATWWWQQRNSAAPTPAVAAVELTPEEAEAYLLENAAEFDPELIARELELEAALAAESAPAPPRRPATRPADEDDLAPLLEELSDEELEDLLEP